MRALELLIAFEKLVVGFSSSRVSKLLLSGLFYCFWAWILGVSWVTLLDIYKQALLEQPDKGTSCRCPPFLLMLAAWLGSSVSLVGPGRGRRAAGQGRGITRGSALQRFPIYPVFRSCWRKCSGKLWERGQESRPSLPSRAHHASYVKGFDLFFFFLALSINFIVWFLKGRERPTTFCSLQNPLICSNQKNPPGCPVTTSCVQVTLNPARSTCLMRSSPETAGENCYLKADTWTI